MAYVDPNTVQNAAAGAPLQAARLDVDRDDLEYLARNKPHCRVYNSANISHTTSGTPQIVTFNSERFDVGGCHSTSSNTGRLTVPSGEGGKYQISGHISWATSATGIRQIYIRLNGTTPIADDVRTPVSGTGTSQHVSTFYALSAGDYVELIANQTSGGALQIDAANNYSPEFSMHWVAI